MSRRDYGRFYNNKPQTQETINEPIVKPQTEEIHAAEETQEERHNEASAEEQKMEDAYNITKVGPNSVTQEPLIKKAKVFGAARVNMRISMSKNAQVITVLPEGTEVIVLDKSSDSSWTKIVYKDMTGYMMSQFLKEI